MEQKSSTVGVSRELRNDHAVLIESAELFLIDVKREYEPQTDGNKAKKGVQGLRLKLAEVTAESLRDEIGADLIYVSDPGLQGYYKQKDHVDGEDVQDNERKEIGNLTPVAGGERTAERDVEG